MSEKVIELWSARFVGRDNLTVENCIAYIKCGCNLIAEADEAAHQVAVARYQAATALMYIAKGAEAVVFEIKEPLRVVEPKSGV